MTIKYLIVMCLVLLLPCLPAIASTQTEYFAVFMEGKKIGYAIQSRVAADGKVTTSEEVNIQVSRDGVPVSISTTATSIETADGKPLGFEAVQNLGLMVMNISGAVNKQGMVNMTITSTMGGEQKRTFKWPSGAVMAEGLRLQQLEKGLKEGLEYGAKLFDPGNIQAIEAKIHIGPKRNVDLLGRIVALTEVETVFKLPNAGEVVGTSYVDRDLRVQKNIVPMAGMQVEMVACAKEFAMSENDVLELIDKMFLSSPEPLDSIESAKSAIYHLRPTGQASTLTIPSSDNQSVQRLREGGVIVTVRPVAPQGGAKFPYEGRESSILEAMKPTRFVQSDHSEIIELANRAVGDTKDAAEAVKRIESFVSEYIENRSLSVGYASAAEVAASRVGDCSEFAVLTASMCRAVGIPARMVCGLVYVEDYPGRENMFGSHAWVEAYVGDRWIGLDATRAPNGFGAGYIALAIGNGEPADFFGMVSTLGYFNIEKVVVEK